MRELSQQEKEEQPPLPTARSCSGKSHAGTDLVCPVRHRKGEGIRVLFRVTGVDVLDAARGHVCLAEGTNSCPWKMNKRGKNVQQKEQGREKLQEAGHI